MIDERQTSSVRRKYNRNARWFDQMDRMIQDSWRRRITQQATGRVLEIGVGTGKNLEFFDPVVTTSLVGIDLSSQMLSRARAKYCAVPLTLEEMDAQRMSFPDASFDTVIATCVFCTVPDPYSVCRRPAGSASQAGGCCYWSTSGSITQLLAR